MSINSKYYNLIIPFILIDIKSDDIIEIFEKNQIAQIDEIILIPYKNNFNKRYNEAFIHINNYYNTSNSINFRAFLDSGITIIIYDDYDNYWDVLVNEDLDKLNEIKNDEKYKNCIYNYINPIIDEKQVIDAEPVYNDNQVIDNKDIINKMRNRVIIILLSILIVLIIGICMLI